MNCEECPLNGGVKIHGEGCITVGSKIIAVKEEREYDVVVVGMAPAREEVNQRRPFVGVSGQILRKHLYQMGIEEYYVCNALLCPITEDPLVPQAVNCCRSIVEEIKGKKPKLTIVLGDLPLHIVAPNLKYTIRECEGRVLPSLVGPILPLTHPAYYWRHPDEIYDFTECMRSGLRFLEGTYTQAIEPTYTIVDSNNLTDALNDLDKHEKIAVDLETTGLSAYGWDPNEILEMGISGDHKHAYIVPKEMIPEFKDILEKKKCRWWNAQFDCSFLKQLGINANADFDGMLAHCSIDERPYKHGLKRVAQVYLGCDNWEKEIDKYLPGKGKETVNYGIIPTDVRYEYLSKDVTRTYQLCDVLEPMTNKKVFNELLMPACRMFIDIEEKGMRIDPIRMMDMGKILTKELENLESELYKEVGSWINPNSPKQVSDLVYNKLKVPVDSSFGFSTSKIYLEGFRDSIPIVDKILDYREISKLRNGYVDQFAKFVDRDFRVHPRIRLEKAITGRLASEKPSVMNIKSLKDLKRLFLPSIGSIFGHYDIKGNELRWYCIISGDKELTRILQNGGDPHNVVSIAAYGESRAKEMRTQAKAVVFGRIYGRQKKSIGMQVGMDVLDAVMDAVDNIAPDIDKYYKEIMRQVRTQGYLDSYFGRRRRFSLITPETRKGIERQAINFPSQSSGSDLMLLCMLHIWEMKEKFGVWPFWPVHDSISMDIPDVGTLPVVKKELEEYAFEVVHGAMPFIWEADYGLNWALDKELPERRKVWINTRNL